MAVVLDASLLVTLLTGDPRGVEADRLIRGWNAAGEPMHTTALMRYEVASALTRCVTSGTLVADQAAASWLAIDALAIEEHPLAGERQRVVQIALQLRRRSAYDAAYIALAEALSAELWTFDAALARNAGPLGFRVRLV